MLISKINDLNNKKHNKKLKFLVIEDDKSVQKLMTLLLPILFNCKVSLADSGEKATEIASIHSFDLIFTDIDLPGINGITTSHIIRNLANHMNDYTPIIAVSGNLEARQRCFEVGINAFLAKPFTKEELIKTVKQLGFLPKS